MARTRTASVKEKYRKSIMLAAVVVSIGASSAMAQTNLGADFGTGQSGCAPNIQTAQQSGLEAGFQNALTISQSERKAAGKIINDCFQNMITALQSLDILTNGLGAINSLLQTGMNKILNAALQQVCAVATQEFNNIVARPFNEVAFLSDVIPCGGGLSVDITLSGGSGANFCGVVQSVTGGTPTAVITNKTSTTSSTTSSSTSAVRSVINSVFGGTN